MFRHSAVQLLKRRYRLIVIGGILGAILSLLPLLVIPLEYRADAGVFIITKTRYGVDPYTVVKSAERVAENISEVMKTDDFFGKVMTQSQYDFNRARFEGVSERAKRIRWQKALQTSVTYGTGGLIISAFDKSPDKAMALAAASANALAQHGWEYVGGDVTIKVVNTPVVTRLPVRPNVWLNAALGMMAGVLVAGVVLVRRG